MAVSSMYWFAFGILFAVHQVSSECDQEGLFNSGRYCFMSSTREMTWMESLSFCNQFDYESAFMFDESDMLEVEEYFEHLGKTGSYWTGGNDEIQEGEWYWEDFEGPGNFKNQDSTFWAPGQPRTSTLSNCLYVRSKLGKLRWYSSHCQARKFALCMEEIAPKPQR